MDTTLAEWMRQAEKDAWLDTHMSLVERYVWEMYRSRFQPAFNGSAKEADDARDAVKRHAESAIR